MSSVNRAVRAALLGKLRKRGIQVTRTPPFLCQRPDFSLYITLEHLVAQRVVQGESRCFVVQIGAFDGCANDPLHDFIVKYGWEGIIVEPQSTAFKLLCSTYSDHPQLTLRNVAVGERDESRAFYRVKEGPDVPEWAAQLASFDRETILRHDNRNGLLRRNLVCEQVACVSFDSLLDDVAHVDLLQIDAEGCDGTLIGLFDFKRWRPSIVQFEHRHLSTAEHNVAIVRLAQHGYRLAISRYDTIAYGKGRRTTHAG